MSTKQKKLMKKSNIDKNNLYVLQTTGRVSKGKF